MARQERSCLMSEDDRNSETQVAAGAMPSGHVCTDTFRAAHQTRLFEKWIVFAPATRYHERCTSEAAQLGWAMW